MLTCALMTQVKELKIKIKNNFYIKTITFASFKTLMHKFQKKTFIFGFLTYASMTQLRFFCKIMLSSNESNIITHSKRTPKVNNNNNNNEKELSSIKEPLIKEIAIIRGDVAF